jgi:hypothetical protein
LKTNLPVKKTLKTQLAQKAQLAQMFKALAFIF